MQFCFGWMFHLALYISMTIFILDCSNSIGVFTEMLVSWQQGERGAGTNRKEDQVVLFQVLLLLNCGRSSVCGGNDIEVKTVERIPLRPIVDTNDEKNGQKNAPRNALSAVYLLRLCVRGRVILLCILKWVLILHEAIFRLKCEKAIGHRNFNKTIY